MFSVVNVGNRNIEKADWVIQSVNGQPHKMIKRGEPFFIGGQRNIQVKGDFVSGENYTVELGLKNGPTKNFTVMCGDQ